MEGPIILIVFLIIYSAIMLWIGWFTRKWITGAGDFIVAGREVSLLITIFGVASIGWAGTAVTLHPGMAIRFGFWTNLLFAASYPIIGYVIYGFFFTRYVRRCGAITLPEWLEMRFSTNVRRVVAICAFIALMGVLANNVLSMATVLQGFLGWPLWIGISGTLALFLIYTVAGGLWAVTITDFAQMLMGLVGVPFIVFGLLTIFGGGDWLVSHWPNATHDLGMGVTGATLPLFNITYPSALTVLLLYGPLLVWGSQHYWLRVASARSERAAKWGFIGAGVLLFVLNGLLLGPLGMYAAGAHPTAFTTGGGTVLPEAAFGVVMTDLPILLASYMVMFSLAASMSTSSSVHIAATSVALRDIYQRIFKPKATPAELVIPSRWIAVILGIGVWVLSFFPGGPLFLFAFATAFLGPASVLLLMGILWRRTTARAALIGAVCGLVVMVIWQAADMTGLYRTSTIAHIGVVGFVVTFIPTWLISYFTKPKYFGEPGWSVKPGPAEEGAINAGAGGR